MEKNNTDEFVIKIKERIIEFNKLLDKVVEEKYKFTQNDVKELIRLIIEANSNSITKELLSQNYDNSIVDHFYDNNEVKHHYTGNLYTRMQRIKPELAEFFGCKQDEIGIVFDNKNIGKINDIKAMSIVEGRHPIEEIPYKVIIGDAQIFGKSSTSSSNLSIENLRIVIGDLNISGYQGKISDNLTISGNLIADKDTDVELMDGLFIGGTAFGLEYLTKKKKDLEGNNKDKPNQEYKGSDLLTSATEFLSPDNYKTTAQIFSEILEKTEHNYD